MNVSRAKSNRGPAAAGANRAALLRSARRLFTARGYEVPLSAIARGAGVGQGVLYRHFPTRLDLAVAVFEDHFRQYEAIAQEEDPTGLFDLWAAIVDHLISSTAFVDMVIDARTAMPDYPGVARLEGIIERVLARAQGAGLVRKQVTVAGVMLSLRMAYGLVRTRPENDSDGALRETILNSFPALRRPSGAAVVTVEESL